MPSRMDCIGAESASGSSSDSERLLFLPPKSDLYPNSSISDRGMVRVRSERDAEREAVGEISRGRGRGTVEVEYNSRGL
jgi:hypothetical protein